MSETCRNGHVRTPENTRVEKGRGYRCLDCKKDRAKEARTQTKRPERTHCNNGHLYTPETFRLYGGTRRCMLCRRKHEEIRAMRRRGELPPKPDTLPAAPLLKLISTRGGIAELSTRRGDQVHGTNRRRAEKSYARILDAGCVTLDAADRMCVELLGMHPAEVYGEQWWELTG